LLQALRTDNITGASTTRASAAPELGPKSVMTTATASSNKLPASMSAPGEVTPRGI